MIDTQGLSVHYAGLHALDGIDFSLGYGELHCLIGPNGAGKSTFFRCLTGEQRPTIGDISLDGQSIVGWHPHEIARKGVGIKTQVPSVMNGLSTRENVWIAAKRGRSAVEASRRASEAIELCEVGKIASRQVGAMAHGERQKVELACVLATKPNLLLLDEPVAGLSPEEIAWLADLIKDLEGKISIIVVEHNMNFVAMIAHKVTVFHQGEILAQGDCADVLANPQVRQVYLGRN